jgi:hypothetical protein
MNFQKAMKSTLDSVVHALATANGFAYLDLDAAAYDSDLVASEQPAITWARMGAREEPRDPLWAIDFQVGGKTSIDPAQYVSMDIIDVITSKFKVGLGIDISDYSGVSQPTQRLGQMVVTGVHELPQQYDQTAGLRMVHVSAKAVRFP